MGSLLPRAPEADPTRRPCCDDFSRRSFFRTLGAGVSSLALSAAAQTGERRPNVLVILPDEWRGQALNCMGNHQVHTPNADRLASEGMLFSTTLANTPVCCPARANLLTGTYTSTNGMTANDLRLRESTETLGNWFGKAGYRTGYIGKWHLDGGPRVPGFVPPDRRHGFEFWAANECWHNYYYGWYFRDTDVPVITTRYEPEVWTDLAIEFLYQQQGATEPFFLMVSPGAPHDPYIAPETYMNQYDPRSLNLRPNWVEGTAHAGRKEVAAYYAAVTAVDNQIGRLTKAMRELGLEDNTIVLLTSDHGNMLGSQGKVLKRKPWEESIRVPGILRYPRAVKAGRKSDVLLSHVDIAPTLLSLCGLQTPSSIQGTDLSRVVLGQTESGPHSAFFQIFGPYHAGGVAEGWRGVRTQQFMYARTESKPWLLYDLTRDPYEQNNLVNDAHASATRDDLDRQLSEWMRKIGDSWKLDWTAPVEDGGRLYDYRTFYTVDEYLQWAKGHPTLAPRA